MQFCFHTWFPYLLGLHLTKKYFKSVCHKLKALRSIYDREFMYNIEAIDNCLISLFNGTSFYHYRSILFEFHFHNSKLKLSWMFLYFNLNYFHVDDSPEYWIFSTRKIHLFPSFVSSKYFKGSSQTTKGKSWSLQLQ